MGNTCRKLGKNKKDGSLGDRDYEQEAVWKRKGSQTKAEIINEAQNSPEINRKTVIWGMEEVTEGVDQSESANLVAKSDIDWVL